MNWQIHCCLRRKPDQRKRTILFDTKSFTKDVDKGTNELVFKKKKVNKLHRKGLNQFELQSNGTQGWFKLDIEFLKRTLYKINSELQKEIYKSNIEEQDMGGYKMFVVPLYK